MRKGVGLFVAITVGMVVVLEAPRVAQAVSRSGIFRVVDVSVEGTTYLTPDEVVAATAIPPDASVWDDTEPMVERLRENPMVEDARIHRKLPGGLVLEVTEREPVGLLPSPTLAPVDRDGHVLPLDPAGRHMDLPLVQPRVDPSDRGDELTPAQIRELTSDLSRLETIDPTVLASISEVALDAWGGAILYLGEPRVALRYWPPLLPGTLNDALLVLGDALERQPDRTPVSVDLRFADQVVVRYDGAGR
jgi:cell division septal protein FtsQ